MRRDNFIGARFGRLTVISSVDSDLNGHSHWLCECVCGKQIVAYGSNLKRGLTTSCGCKRKEVTIEEKTTHGMYGTPLYHSGQVCFNDAKTQMINCIIVMEEEESKHAMSGTTLKTFINGQ